MGRCRHCHVAADLLLAKGTRRVPVAGFSRHLVFCRLNPQGILVLRIVHGARDLESLFSA